LPRIAGANREGRARSERAMRCRYSLLAIG
jgi:hypothetical protein